jgi:molybdopterin synthase catalytic subunit
MSDFIELTINELNVEQITDLVGSPNCGAISVFIGVTRDNINGKRVIKLEYEAYSSMALKELESICTQIRMKWPNIENIAIHHRIGEVAIKESSIIIAISSPHRKDSLEAVNYCIDKVNKKKEGK